MLFRPGDYGQRTAVRFQLQTDGFLLLFLVSTFQTAYKRRLNLSTD